ncbi:hypothetical protein EGY19_28725 [Burkholderia multivorans]|nr:hypothetical protein EGY19_28725 [Burkholderia multivorans]PRF48546.1 hypothetical protein C6Q04_11725 [Burkholderia multivorans]PRG49272.1 hypothetical protein C6T63_21125 [Burkholderia multivorans]
MRGTAARSAIAGRSACRNGASVLRAAYERRAGRAVGGAPSCGAAAVMESRECGDVRCCTCASGNG